MTHYNVAQWSDYVRGFGSDLERAQMRAHLDTGCAECGQSVVWLRGVVENAGVDARVHVPDDLVTRAKAIFQPPEEPGWVENLEQLAATLVAHASRDWQPAGIRSATGLGVRSVYRAGDFSVNLQIEPMANEGCTDIAGQVLHKAEPQAQLEPLVVQIIADGRVLVQTETNQFGEFLFEEAEYSSAILRIAMKRFGFRIDLPLQNQIANHS